MSMASNSSGPAWWGWMGRAMAHALAACALLAGSARGEGAKPVKEGETFSGPEVCGACHEAEFEQWKDSYHARAYSDSFRTFWEKNGSKPECLACHTTGYDQKTQAYQFEGVTCESCHGAYKEDHPGEGTMYLGVDSDACMPCHQQTILEWKLSGHARGNVRCFDCHVAHGQGLRREQASQQCAACHAQRMDDFTHATHGQEGLTCMTCHMPEPRDPGISGTGVRGHSLIVGAETCAACHESMVHDGHRMGSLEEQVEALSQQAQVKFAESLQDRVHDLEVALAKSHRWTVKAGVGAGVVGLILGGLMGLIRPLRKRPKGEGQS